MKESEELRERLKVVIQSTCNKIGCKNCDLKWPTSCSAVDLELKILEAEYKEEIFKDEHSKL